MANAAVNRSLGSGTNILIGGAGTLQYTGTGHSTTRPVTITATGATTDASGSGLATFGGTMTGTGFGLFLTGTGSGAYTGNVNTVAGER